MALYSVRYCLHEGVSDLCDCLISLMLFSVINLLVSCANQNNYVLLCIIFLKSMRL